MDKQPNSWSCLPTAFAYVLGIPVTNVLELVGHDGSQIINPRLPEPRNRRSFHIQEMVDVCHHYQHLACLIQAMPCFDEQDIMEAPKAVKRLQHYLNLYNGVIIGSTRKDHRHAVAWINGTVHDPNGTKYGLENRSLVVEEFYIVHRIRSEYAVQSV